MSSEDMQIEQLCKKVYELEKKIELIQKEKSQIEPLTDIVKPKSKNASKEKPVKEKPVKEKVKKEKQEKPISGYLLFSKEMRETIKADLIKEKGDEIKCKPTLILSEIGKKWNELSVEERDTWKDKATAINKEKGLI